MKTFPKYLYIENKKDDYFYVIRLFGEPYRDYNENELKMQCEIIKTNRDLSPSEAKSCLHLNIFDENITYDNIVFKVLTEAEALAYAL